MAKRKIVNEEERKRFPDGFRILQGKQEYVSYVEHSSIRIWSSDVAAHYDNHVHSAVEIIMPLRGVSVYRLGDRACSVRPGEILIVPSGCPHELTEPEETQRYLFLFEPNLFISLRDMPDINDMLREPIYLKEGEAREAAELLMRVVSCYFEKKPLWNTQCYSYLMQMYVILGRRYLARRAPESVSGGSVIDAEIMNSALTYINEHYRDDISLEDVASFAGFSKYYFSRIFKQFSGTSYTEFLTRKRLAAATDLLIYSRKPIHEIAAESGFGSVASFNRVFRGYKNLTPTQYRAIYGAAADTEGMRENV